MSPAACGCRCIRATSVRIAKDVPRHVIALCMEIPYNSAMEADEIAKRLQRLSEKLQLDEDVEMVLVGGAAGMLTGQLSPDRVTMDCDVIRCIPGRHFASIQRAARKLAQQENLPPNWLNDDVSNLDILPDGWRTRRVQIGRYARLTISCVSRKDLIAMKFLAGHPRDVEDIQAMAPNAEELAFARTYLNMLRVPSRRADLDQIQSSVKLLEAFQGSTNDGH